MEHEILLGLTTTPKSDWREKVQEMKNFGIRRIALFPTFLDVEKRKELYGLLEQVEGLEIPHVHLRSQDMEEWEMEWFEGRGAKIYNIHCPKTDFPVLQKYRDRIFIENHFGKMKMEILQRFGGICLDASHLEASRIRKRPEYAQIRSLLEKIPVGCCHVSAVNGNTFNPLNYIFGFDKHYCRELASLDYIGQYKQYLPKYVSLELENSFKQQLEAKEYLEKLLNIKYTT